MKEQEVIGKINEMLVVQTAVLNNYQKSGEIVDNTEIRTKFNEFARLSQENINTLLEIIESLQGGIMTNIEELADVAIKSFDEVVTNISFNKDETYRAVYKAYLMETMNHYNWKILEGCKEKEDTRLNPSEKAKKENEKILKWLGDKIRKIELSQLH
ncbi:MAG: hypothetical protein M1355_03120 [Patescibacteria group bacterium]|nr:hypothetical protein [Patescibacteria group bacterium]